MDRIVEDLDGFLIQYDLLACVIGSWCDTARLGRRVRRSNDRLLQIQYLESEVFRVLDLSIVLTNSIGEYSLVFWGVKRLRFFLQNSIELLAE